MNLTKKHYIIIGVVIALIAVWYFFLRKKPTESNYKAARKVSPPSRMANVQKKYMVLNTTFDLVIMPNGVLLPMCSFCKIQRKSVITGYPAMAYVGSMQNPNYIPSQKTMVIEMGGGEYVLAKDVVEFTTAPVQVKQTATTG